jgi:uncharacterized protein YndB with AHSA1/START domain
MTGEGDAIERELTLQAPIERVWRAITDPAEVSKWFGVEAEIDLTPGGDVAFGWSQGRFRARVEAVEPPRRFAYRWCLDSDTPVDEGPTTLVEFTLRPEGEGTRLRLVESGFASLPEDGRARHLADNTKGWEEELGELRTYVEGAAVPE